MMGYDMMRCDDSEGGREGGRERERERFWQEVRKRVLCLCRCCVLSRYLAI